jgi:hypothetical protein
MTGWPKFENAERALMRILKLSILLAALLGAILASAQLMARVSEEEDSAEVPRLYSKAWVMPRRPVGEHIGASERFNKFNSLQWHRRYQSVQ